MNLMRWTRVGLTTLVLSLFLHACSGSGAKDGEEDKTKADSQTSDRTQGDADTSVPPCTPGERQCGEGGEILACQEDGTTWMKVHTCYDGNECTLDSCVNGSCSFSLSAKCIDTDQCTDDFCLPFSGECSNDATSNKKGCCQNPVDCNDSSDCTVDSCEVPGGSCIHSVQQGCVELLFSFGEKGEQTGQLKNPKGITVLADGRVAISDSGNSRFLLLSPSGEQLYELKEAYGKALMAPAGIFQSSGGDIYLCDAGNDRVLILDSNGSPKDVWPPANSLNTQFFGPADIVLDDEGFAYVADGPGEGFDEGNRILKLNKEGKVVKTQGKTGSADGNFFLPSGIELSKQGTLFISDQSNNRVQLLSSNLEFVGKFGAEGKGLGQLDSPTDLLVTPEGKIFVVDFGNQRLQVFDVCQPDCTGKVCGSDGCVGSCGECPSFATCNDSGQCEGWVGEAGEGCTDNSGKGVAGCGGCGCEQCVCTGEGVLDPTQWTQPDSTSDPYCCETEWDALCIYECVMACGYSCPVSQEQEPLEPTFAALFEWKSAGSEALTAPVKVAMDSQRFLYVLDTVKSRVHIYKVHIP